MLHVDPNRKLVELHTVQQHPQVPTDEDDWLALLFAAVAIGNHVCAGDYEFFAELFQVDSLLHVAPYVLKFVNGGRYVLWVLDNDPDPSSMGTFELPNIHQVWRGSGYISFYNDSGCPTGIPLSYVQRIQRTIRWGGLWKQGSSARYAVELGPCSYVRIVVHARIQNFVEGANPLVIAARDARLQIGKTTSTIVQL